MGSRLRMFVAAFALLHISTAFDCSIPPIFIDLHDRVVHGTDTFQYGLFTGVGSPGQNQSLWPSLSQNETSVADFRFCDNSDLENCERSTRGNFDISESPTFIRDDQHQSLDNGSVVEDGFFGSDDFYLYTHYFEPNPATQTHVRNFSIQVATAGSESPGILGLGQTSTILRTLFNNGLIAGKTLGLYTGSAMTDRTGVNGSLTLGGYDAARFTGPVHSFPMDTTDRNALRVTVQDIILTQANNQNTSLLDNKLFPNTSNTPFPALLSTDQYPLSLPSQLTQNLLTLLSASTSESGTILLPAPTSASLTILLSSGLSITIPASILTPASLVLPLSPANQDSTTPAILSTAFLTQVYLMADYDAYTFHLAPAVPTASFVSEQVFCPRTTPSVYIAPSSNFWNSGMIGAVIGGVIGGFALIAAVVWGTVWCIRGREARRMQREEDGEEGWVREIEMKRLEGRGVVVAVQQAGESGGGDEKGKKGGKFWRK